MPLRARQPLLSRGWRLRVEEVPEPPVLRVGHHGLDVAARAHDELRRTRDHLGGPVGGLPRRDVVAAGSAYQELEPSCRPPLCGGTAYQPGMTGQDRRQTISPAHRQQHGNPATRARLRNRQPHDPARRAPGTPPAATRSATGAGHAPSAGPSPGRPPAIARSSARRWLPAIRRQPRLQPRGGAAASRAKWSRLIAYYPKRGLLSP